MINITFKPARDEFGFLGETYEGVNVLMNAIQSNLIGGGHTVECIDILKGGVIVVWCPGGNTTRSNTFVGFDYGQRTQ